MKSLYKVFAVLGLVLGFAACEGDKFTDSIFIDPVEDTTTYTYQFDQWLDEFYTEPYNVEFLYKLDDNATDPNYNVVPVSIGMADTMAHLALYLWYDVYDSVVNPEFLPKYGPKMIQLIGSSMMDPVNNTEKLGYAEGGIKITILKVNKMQLNNIDNLNEYIFKTMHHEFAHILHQQKNYPTEFAQITPANYDPIKWQERSYKEAWQLGCVSNYGSSEAREDFVEVIANYIVKPDAWWDNMLKEAGTEGAALINQKWEICNTWLKDKWEIDLNELRAEVQKRQANLDWDMIMKAKYLLLIGLFAATMVACSRDEESLFEDSAAIRAQKAIDNAFDVLTSTENGWEMAYFPNLEADAKGYNMVLKFNKNGNVSVTAKNATTTGNKIVTDTASTWAVKSDYGPILTFDTYNDVFHAFSDPREDGAGLLGDYEFLILKATPELVLLKGKKHSAYTVLRPMKTTDLAAYFAACEKMQTDLFGNNNIVTLTQGNEKLYLYNGANGQFQSAAYGSKLVAEAATYHPVCATEDGIIVSTGFGEDVHDHVFYYDSIKGELKSEQGTVMNAGNLNLLYRSYFTDNLNGWTVDPTAVDSVASFLEQVNTLVKDTKNNTNIKVLGYGYKQSLNMYEGGHFIVLQFGYKNGGKGKEQVIKLVWTVDITADENGITVANPTPYDDNTNRWITNLPIVTNIMESLLGTFKATPAEGHLFNAVSGMILAGDANLPIMGSSKVSM